MNGRHTVSHVALSALTRKPCVLYKDIVHFDQLQFLRWLDLMGVQRHLKAIGIFAQRISSFF